MTRGRGTTEVDAVTLAVVSGALSSTVRQMTLTMERTARSPVFKLVRDFSNAVFDAEPRMAVQGEDLPIHLGSLIHATKAVAGYFADDVRPGDVFYHNDPVTGGSHLQDMCMFKPVFVEDELVFWASNKAHMDDTGGAVAGGYDPLAEEIYAEGLRMPPLRIHDAGVPRRDVIDLIVGSVRTGTQQRNDMGAQLAALSIAERNLLALVRRYGRETVAAAVDRILDIGEENMRRTIAAMPDGVYEGSSRVEDDGRSGELTIACRVEIAGDELHVSVTSPPQVRSYINSYWANTLSAVYYGVLTYAGIPVPYNEGLYRPVHVDLGPPGTLTNASSPAACGAATTTVGDNITDAVRVALSKAAPERTVAGWCHCAGTNQVGTDPASGDHYTFNMIIGTGGGGGATWGLDGWHCLNTAAGAGGILAGDVELLEHEFPVQIHRYELRPDSAGAGRWRGGLGPEFEVEPLGHDAALVLWGEGTAYPALGLLGAGSPLAERKVARRYLIDDGAETELPPHGIVPIRAGQRLRTCPAGGGGVGDPLERELEAVRADVENGLVSLEAAREEYGVVVDPDTRAVDGRATDALRRALAEARRS
jgi:N-methylhydantoinase B